MVPADGAGHGPSLAVTTPSDREIVITRGFAAPRHLVFAAWTRPELLRRWFGPHGHRLVVCEIDLRVGGSWRYVVRAPDGSEMELRGVYREIVPPERLVCTEESECETVAGEELLVTAVFTEREGQTTLTMTVRYPTQALRDAVLNTRMAEGLAEGYDKLAELLALPELPELLAASPTPGSAPGVT